MRTFANKLMDGLGQILTIGDGVCTNSCLERRDGIWLSWNSRRMKHRHNDQELRERLPVAPSGRELRTTMFQGFGERVPDELTASACCTMQIKVICPPEQKYSVWVEAHFILGGTSGRRNTTRTFSCYRVCLYTESRQDE